MAKNKRYLVDFTASVGGTVLITGKDKKDALRNLKRADHVWDQIVDQVCNVKADEFDIKFDERSIVKDEDEGTDPFTDFGQEDDEEE